MQNRFLKKFAIVLAVFLVVIIGQITLPSMRIYFFGLWPVFIFIFLVSFLEKGAFPLAVAFLAGALIDFISGAYFGIFTLSFFSIALIMKAAEGRLKFSNPFAVAFTFVLCALCFFGISHLLLYVF